MVRSALGAFLILVVASLAFVSHVTKPGGVFGIAWPLGGSKAAPPQANLPASAAMPSAAVAPPVPAAALQPVDLQMEIPADPRGQYATNVVVNGRTMRMLVDTGASSVALTSEDARALGLRLSQADFRIRISTANGTALAAPARLGLVEIGDIRIYDVDAFVSQPGALQQSLLGMTALRKLRSFEISGGRLVLKQ
jgi:aspartyl protease family protein